MKRYQTTNFFAIFIFCQCETPYFGPVNIGKCIYLGKSAGNDSKEITLFFRDYNPNGKQQHKNNLGDNSSCILRFIPDCEENGQYWIPLLAKVNSIFNCDKNYMIFSNAVRQEMIFLMIPYHWIVLANYG
jgi:hypothetical protein